MTLSKVTFRKKQREVEIKRGFMMTYVNYNPTYFFQPLYWMNWKGKIGFFDLFGCTPLQFSPKLFTLNKFLKLEGNDYDVIDMRTHQNKSNI